MTLPEYKYTIVRDTREKEGHGWRFNKTDFCCGTIDQTLETGDYTIAGYEHKIVIERKGSVSEWATNISEKRFIRELDRLAAFDWATIVFEFNMSDVFAFPLNSGIPKSRWRYMKISGPYIMKKTIELQFEYPTVNFAFCGSCGKEYVVSLFKRYMEWTIKNTA